jgi:uncharacterized repeat protein (TIGR02543 family)
MKKFYGFLFAAILLLALVGCTNGNNGGGTTTTQFTVTFNTQGGSLIAAQKVNSGATVVKPANPTRNGYTFEGWFTDSACTTAVSWAQAITADVTYYAKWTEKSGSGSTGDVEGLSCAEDRTQEKCLDPNTFDWNYNRFEFDGKGMEIKLYVGIAAENDPFNSGFTGERAS